MMIHPFHRPSVATREIALKESGGRRRFLFSSQILPLFGWEHGLRFRREVVPGVAGFYLTPDPNGVQQVYSRTYRHGRRHEAQIEISSGDFLRSSIPGHSERVHLTLRAGRLEVRPVANHTFSIRKSFRAALDPFTAVMCMSAGVDSHCLASLGFKISGHIEWRPPEARDGDKDLTESGVMTALANSRPDVVINEDIRTLDWLRVRGLLDAQLPVACFHISLGCDDYSPLKGPAARAAALQDLSTTRDLFFDALRAIETLHPVTCVVEQVPGFASSAECEILTVRLRRWGYHVNSRVFDPVEHAGALTHRKRFYLVASLFPGFEFPEPAGRNTVPVLSQLADDLPGCRDVSHCKALRDGIGTPRERHLRPGDTVSPIVTKSQARQTKDSLYVALPDGRYLLPSRRMLQHLCEIPDSFYTDHLSDELAAETIGQSISYRMHHAVMSKVKEHLAVCHAGGAGLVVEPRRAVSTQAQIEMFLSPTGL